MVFLSLCWVHRPESGKNAVLPCGKTGASGKTQRDTCFTTKVRYFTTSNWCALVQAPLAVAKRLSLHDKSMNLGVEFSPSVFTTSTHFTTPQAVLPRGKIGGFFTSDLLCLGFAGGQKVVAVFSNLAAAIQ